MTSQWDRIATRNAERLRLVAQESYVELGNEIIVRSPVDEGLFRNNFFPTLNKPSDKVTEAKAKKGFGSTGGARYTELLHLSTVFDIGDILFFVNNLPYARKLEFGHSGMAPLGVVRISVARWPMLVDGIARRIK